VESKSSSRIRNERLPPSERPRVVVATGNPGKLREYTMFLDGSGFEAVPYDAGVDETGASYEENAVLKAEAARDATGLPAIGDDAGVELDALGGFPGLRSARLAPTQAERTAELLKRLAPFPRPWLAKFVAALALAAPGRATVVVRGERPGEVIPEWRGTVGFGYDPVFLIPEDGRTFGEMEPDEKGLWSHRGAAFRKLRETHLLDELKALRTNASASS